ncbi:MAG: peptidoglycan-binding protein [Pseudomonadota bacterium]
MHLHATPSLLIAGLLLGLSGCSTAPIPDAGSAPPTLGTPPSPTPPAHARASRQATAHQPALPLSQAAPVSAPPLRVPAPRTAAPETLTLPAPRPGECWALATVHPREETRKTEIVVQDAVNRIEVRPARLEKAQREIVVHEGGVTYRIEPPVYAQVKEKIEVKPEIRRTVVIPAVFEEREERVQIEAAHTELAPCRVPGAKNAQESGLCAQQRPARTETVKRRVLLRPESTDEIVEPAQYREITRHIIRRPARIVAIERPDRTAAIEVRQMAEPEKIDEQQLPPQVRHLLTTRYVGEPGMVIRQTVCADTLTPRRVRQVQDALRAAGFDPGPSDGKLGRQTRLALDRYQRTHTLAAGALTLETLAHLGLH